MSVLSWLAHDEGSKKSMTDMTKAETMYPTLCTSSLPSSCPLLCFYPLCKQVFLTMHYSLALKNDEKHDDDFCFVILSALASKGPYTNRPVIPLP